MTDKSVPDLRLLSLLPGMGDTENGPCAEWIRKNLSVREAEKGTILLRAGESLSQLWFINKGLVKYYYIDFEGHEKIKHFSREGNMVLSVNAFLEKGTSRFFIGTLEPTALFCFPAGAVCHEIGPDGILGDVFRNYMTRSLLEKETREADFLLLDGKRRYEKFVMEHPDLSSRLKQFEIASYLGMDPAHLSRIRAAR